MDDNDLEGLMEREFLWNDITVMNSGHKVPNETSQGTALLLSRIKAPLQKYEHLVDDKGSLDIESSEQSMLLAKEIGRAHV